MSAAAPEHERHGGLDGRVVVVTGASRGIGRGVAERFGREGARVVAAARHAEPLQTVVGAIERAGGSAIAALADVSNRGDVDRLFDAAVAAFGHVDVLVNNAAIVGRDAHALELADDELGAFLATNVMGAFYCAERAGRLMARRRSGAIVNVTSVVASRPGRKMVAYATSKAALEGLTRALALDLAPFGVRVNGVAPGIVFDESRRAAAAPAQLGSREQLVPLGRVSRPADVAAACAFLASDDASSITGQILCVDGGLTTQIRSMADDPQRFDAASIRL
jgi:3-oxoacyl-[acyl-carrier protein] reductase